MKNDILPIGSIITADGKDLMICAYIKKDALVDNKHFDYACCLYPVGLSKEAILVKKDQIRRVKFIGFQDSRFVDLKKELVKENE